MKKLGIPVTLLASAMASSAAAYSDPSTFDLSANDGGGGGRFFTGSPADAYSCAVCHTGPSRLDVSVNGLPNAYSPGLVYDIVMQWPAGVDEVSGTFEVVDAAGQAIGNLSVPDAAVALPAGLCDSGASQFNTVFELATKSGSLRQVLGVAGCEGATLAQFRWQAPDTDQGPVEFVGGVVHALTGPDDEGGTPDNDQVTQLRRAIPSVVDPEVPVPTQALSCTVAPVGGPSGLSGALPGLLGLASLGWLSRRRRAR